MATSDSPNTFSELYTDLLNRVRADTSVTATATQAKRYINVALHDLHIGFGEFFPWAERTQILRTRAPYTTGTLTATQGSTTLTGASTAWNTNDAFSVANVRAGGKMYINGGPEVYEVSAVASDTSLTLTTAWIGSTASALTYTYFEDEYALHADFLRPLDMQRFSSAANIPLMNRRDFRRAHPRNATTGRPKVATIVDRAPSGSAAVRRRVVFWQPPDDEYLIPYNFVTNKLAVSSAGVEQANLSADTDEPIVPAIYRNILVIHALKNWYRDKKDDARSSEVQGEWVDLMTRITGDQQIGANRPVFQANVGHIAGRARNPWAGSPRHHTLGSRFDEVR